jgi:hypothetical protein
MSCFNKVAIELQWIAPYIVSCNFTIHATCLLALIANKYDKLQKVIATQKLSCKANCKMPFFSHSDIVHIPSWFE